MMNEVSPGKRGSFAKKILGTILKSTIINLTGSEYKKTLDDYVHKNFQEFQKAEKISITYCDISSFLMGHDYIFERTLSLSLEGNSLSYIEPKAIFPVVTELNLSINKFKLIPKHIGSTFKSLQVLNLRKNQLDEIPNKVTEGLINLEVIDLSQNRIIEFPISLMSCTKLRVIRIVRNKIKRLQEKIFVSFPKLRELILSGNPLTKLSHSIHKLRKLETLGIAHTQITELPSTIAEMRRLKSLYIENTPLKTPKLIWAERGIKAIRKYFGKKENLSSESESNSSSDGEKGLLFPGYKISKRDESSICTESMKSKRKDGSLSSSSSFSSSSSSRSGSKSKSSMNNSVDNKQPESGAMEESKTDKNKISGILGLFMAPKQMKPSTSAKKALDVDSTKEGAINIFQSAERSFDQSQSEMYSDTNFVSIHSQLKKLTQMSKGEHAIPNYMDAPIGKYKITYAETYETYIRKLNEELYEDRYHRILECFQFNDFEFYKYIAIMLAYDDPYRLKLNLSYIKAYLEEFFEEMVIKLKFNIPMEEININRRIYYEINTLDPQFILKIGKNKELLDILQYCGFYLKIKFKSIRVFRIKKTKENYEHCQRIAGNIDDLIKVQIDFNNI